METVFLSLGSNIGDRAENIARAVVALAEHGVHVTRQSSLYETEPVDFLDQEWFLNGVIEAQTDLAPRDLMAVLLAVERSLGRERTLSKGPRIIDIDILLFGDAEMKEPQLEIPHPRMTARRFVLVPFAEIAPETRHPVLQKSIAALLQETPDQSEVRIFG